MVKLVLKRFLKMFEYDLGDGLKAGDSNAPASDEKCGENSDPPPRSSAKILS